MLVSSVLVSSSVGLDARFPVHNAYCLWSALVQVFAHELAKAVEKVLERDLFVAARAKFRKQMIGVVRSSDQGPELAPGVELFTSCLDRAACVEMKPFINKGLYIVC